MCGRARVYTRVYGRYIYIHTYMHICASKRPIDSARWLLHFDNSHVEMDFVSGMYVLYSMNRSMERALQIQWLENHYGDFIDVHAIYALKVDYDLRGFRRIWKRKIDRGKYYGQLYRIQKAGHNRAVACDVQKKGVQVGLPPSFVPRKREWLACCSRRRGIPPRDDSATNR